MSSGQAFIIAYVRPCMPPAVSPILCAMATQKASYEEEGYQDGITELILDFVSGWDHHESMMNLEEYLILLN